MRLLPTPDLHVLAPLAAALTIACGGVYQLPPPPPAELQGPVTLDPSEEERLGAARFEEARRAVLSLYEALGAERWADAVSMLSQETRLLLSSGGSASAEQALAAGVVTVDGQSYGFDPVALFLLPGVERFEDEYEDEEEAETGRRKEIFLVAGEEVRKVVLIDEAGQWRLHMRRWPIDRLQRRGG